MCDIDYKKNKMSSRWTDNIEVLLERLGSLQIMNEVSEEMTEWLDKEMSVAQAPEMMNNTQTTIPKSMVLDPEWFDGNRTKFEDWWREI